MGDSLEVSPSSESRRVSLLQVLGVLQLLQNDSMMFHVSCPTFVVMYGLTMISHSSTWPWEAASSLASSTPTCLQGDVQGLQKNELNNNEQCVLQFHQFHEFPCLHDVRAFFADVSDARQRPSLREIENKQLQTVARLQSFYEISWHLMALGG